MSRTLFNLLLVASCFTLLGGCGLTQAVSDGTASTARAIFHKQVNTLRLDLDARTAMNAEGHDMRALSVPTQVRVYQLRDRMALEKASYDAIAADSEALLRDDLLDEHALVLKPGSGAQLNVPLAKETQFVALVALFREPDDRLHTWRLTLRRDQLLPDRARVVELGDNRLRLRPLDKE